MSGSEVIQAAKTLAELTSGPEWRDKWDWGDIMWDQDTVDVP